MGRIETETVKQIYYICACYILYNIYMIIFILLRLSCFLRYIHIYIYYVHTRNINIITYKCLLCEKKPTKGISSGNKWFL